MKPQKRKPCRLKSALLGVAALGAISLVSASPAYATPTPVTGSFGFTVWQGHNPNTNPKTPKSSDLSQIANTSNTIWNGTAKGSSELAAFTYTGALDFCSGLSGRCGSGRNHNNISNFLTDGGGSLSNFTYGSSGSLKKKKLSSGNFDLTTVMQIHSTLAAPIKGTTGTIRSDDGSSIYSPTLTKANLVAENSHPHSPASYSFDLTKLAGGAFDILYVEANGLPAQLKFTTGPKGTTGAKGTTYANVASVPEPGSLGVLGIGLLGIGLLVRRRRRA